MLVPFPSLYPYLGRPLPYVSPRQRDIIDRTWSAAKQNEVGETRISQVLQRADMLRLLPELKVRKDYATIWPDEVVARSFVVRVCAVRLQLCF